MKIGKNMKEFEKMFSLKKIKMNLIDIIMDALLWSYTKCQCIRVNHFYHKMNCNQLFACNFKYLSF